MFIRVKKIRGREYYYLVENKRHGDRVKQKVLKYLGTTRPTAQVIADILKRSA
jgi:hypothetical protein